MDFWRSEAYSTFFDYLDNTGGFYYERWGDAPVHSIGAALLANKSQVHFFRDIGYRHPPFQRCPQGALHSKGKCWCDPGDSFGESFFQVTIICLNTFRRESNHHSDPPPHLKHTSMRNVILTYRHPSPSLLCTCYSHRIQHTYQHVKQSHSSLSTTDYRPNSCILRWETTTGAY